jgi:ABC-type antimicrobial peptide transport system permease subunit
MEIFWEIGLQTVEFLTLIFGILGMTISLMLLFSPHLARNLSNILNRRVNVDKHLEYLDKNIEITEFFYGYHVATGILIVAGSAFSLFFFFFSLDVTKFTDIFFGSQANAFSGELIIRSVTWIGKIGSLAGLVFGILLLFAPDFMKRIEDKLNFWLETKPLIEKFDKSSHDLETFFFRYPIAVGLTGAVLSFFLISLSIINLLK